MKKVYLLLLILLLVGCEIKINECVYNKKGLTINPPCKSNHIEQMRILEQIKKEQCLNDCFDVCDCFSLCFEEVIKNENNCNCPSI